MPSSQKSYINKLMLYHILFDVELKFTEIVTWCLGTAILFLEEGKARDCRENVR